MRLQRINLVPQKSLAERIKRVTPVIIGLLFVAAALLVGAQYYFAVRQLRSVDSDLVERQRSAEQFETLQTQVAVLRSGVDRQKKEYAKLQARVSEIASGQSEKNNFSY